MPELKDDAGRKLNYVRISVTDRCNYRCVYCMPTDGVERLEHDDILRYEDITFLCRTLSGLGVKKFRFTGGEPFVRRGFASFLKNLRVELPSVKIAVTTNGTFLRENADALASVGLSSLNVSLDTLSAQKFKNITRVGNINDVIEGIRAAKKAGVEKIKLNAVLVRGFNDDEVPRLIDFARNEGLLLRLIEFMPVQDSVWNKNSFVSAEETIARLPNGDMWQKIQSAGDDDGPAQYYFNAKTGDTIGVIAAVSDHFCGKCNRLRVSAAGKLRPCLFGSRETPLKEFIKARDARSIEKAIYDSFHEKPRDWGNVKSGDNKMSVIGG